MENTRKLVEKIKDIIIDGEMVSLFTETQYILLVIYHQRQELRGRISEIVEEAFPEYYKNQFVLEISEESEYYLIDKQIDLSIERFEEQGRDGKILYYPDSPFVTIRKLIKLYPHILTSKRLEKILGIVAKTLQSTIQLINCKVQSIELLFQLFELSSSFDFDYKQVIKNLISREQEILKGKNFIFQNDDLILKLVFTFIKYWGQENPIQNLIEILSQLNSSEERYQIYSLQVIERFLDMSLKVIKETNSLSAIVQYTSQFCFHSNYRLRYDATRIMFHLLNTEYSDFAMNRISRMIDDEDYRVKWLVLDNVKRVTLPKTYNYIISKALNDNNYLVRSKAKKITEK